MLSRVLRGLCYNCRVWCQPPNGQRFAAGRLAVMRWSMATDPQDMDTGAPIVEIELTDMAYGGDAVGRYQGRAVFVTGGLAGELVRARLTRERSNYARATLVEV